MFRLDQKGVSLPLVLAILGLVIANTYYFMDVEKSTKEQNLKRGSEIEDNSEKIRLGSFLSDITVCSSPDVFYDKTIIEINKDSATNPNTPSDPLKKGGTIFLQTATDTGTAELPNPNPLYSRGSLRFLYYQITKNAPTVPPQLLEKSYSLIVNYSITDRAGKKPTGKFKRIKLPLYIIFEGGNAAGKIKKCYTEADENLNTVTEAVKQACLGVAAFKVETGLIECHHSVFNTKCEKSEAIVGVRVTSSPDPVSPNFYTQEFVCGHPTNAGTVGPGAGPDCPSTPIQQFIGDLQNDDKFLCKTTDPGCADGQILVMGIPLPGTPKCVKYCLPGELIQNIPSTGDSACISRAQDQCPVGEYAEKISASGAVSCKPYTLKNKACGAGMVASYIDPNRPSTDSADLVLGCKPITIKKDCSTDTSTTFVQSMAVTPLDCHTY